MSRIQEERKIRSLCEKHEIDWRNIDFHYTERARSKKDGQDRYAAHTNRRNEKVFVLYVDCLSVYLVWKKNRSRNDYTVIANDIANAIQVGFVEKGTGYIDHLQETVYICNVDTLIKKLKVFCE